MLTDLRRALGSEAARLRSPEPNTLRLELTGAHADVVAFDAAIARGDPSSLEDAVSLYRGRLLAGCAEEWILPERQARERAYLSALETLAAHALARGDPEAAANHLRLATAVDPLRECAQRRLMEALAAAGEHAAAKRVYRDLRLLLHRELNAEPDPETSALYERIAHLEQRQSTAPGGSAPAGFLPYPVSSLVGRQAELREIGARLHTARLLTLTGEGGVGKTRLAIRAAEERIPHHAGGVWFVDLAPLTDAALLPGVVAAALRIRTDASRPLLETLVRELQSRSALVVLDNCEHLLEACARLAEALLQGCREVRLLATSREPLGIAGEVALPVPALSSPAANGRRLEGDPVPALLEYDAVRLFVERASVASPGWAPDSENIQAAAQVCRHLDGNPLAIELAAARLKVLSVQQVEARLGDRFRLLTRGSRTALPRQQTLRATLDWSYDLLSEAERMLLGRLSVFAGGWTLEAAEAVCKDRVASTRSAGTRGGRMAGKMKAEAPNRDPLHPSSFILLPSEEILDLLTHLVDKSLVVVTMQNGAARYRLLETVRQYAWDRLVERGEAGSERVNAVRRRHRDYFLQLAEDASRDPQGGERVAWLDRMAAEQDNLRAALAWSLENDVGAGLRLAIALSSFWASRDRLAEGSRWLARLLERSSSVRPQFRATAFWYAGLLAQLRGAPGAAWDLYEQGLAIARAVGDVSNVAAALLHMGALACERGDHRQALPILEESDRLYQVMGNVTFSLYSRIRIGIAYHHLGEAARAQGITEESLAVAREAGDRMAMVMALDRLGDMALDREDYPSARAFYEEKLALARSIGDYDQVAQTLNDLAGVSWQSSGDYPAARAAQEEALAVARQFGAANLQTLCLNHMSQLACAEGDLERMAALSRESLKLASDAQLTDRVAEALRQLAAVAAALGSLARSARLLGAADRLQERAGRLNSSQAREFLERTVTAARATLGEAAFRTAWSAGREMTLEQVTAYALEKASTGEAEDFNAYREADAP